MALTRADQGHTSDLLRRLIDAMEQGEPAANGALLRRCARLENALIALQGTDTP